MTEAIEEKRRWREVGVFIVFLAICFGAAGIGSVATGPSVRSEWFSQLAKPSWNPPNWVFAPVWTVLYFLMAVSGWMVWKRARWSNVGGALFCFGVQLSLNVLWSFLFFQWHYLGWAVVDIAGLWLLIAMTMGLFYKHSKLASALLVPYLAWVSFAAVLNFSIYALNAVADSV